MKIGIDGPEDEARGLASQAVFFRAAIWAFAGAFGLMDDAFGFAVALAFDGALRFGARLPVGVTPVASAFAAISLSASSSVNVSGSVLFGKVALILPAFT